MNKSLILAHCSYHKCLTVLFLRVMNNLLNRLIPWGGGYHHFRSHLDEFYRNFRQYRVVSLNNHCPDLERLGDFRMTRFIRDPRDLVVSGYFYHLKGGEMWTRITGPVDRDFSVVNGCVPEGIKSTESYSQFLNRLPRERGLIAEIQFRKKHFESMLSWPDHDPRIRVFRYQDVLKDEARVFSEIMRHYFMAWPMCQLSGAMAWSFSAKRSWTSRRHIRNPVSGQWREYFSPAVLKYFRESFPSLENYADTLESGDRPTFDANASSGL